LIREEDLHVNTKKELNLKVNTAAAATTTNITTTSTTTIMTITTTYACM
jgi:hypothetical protein